ncbi:MAG: hypothetical protein DMG23_00325 [Acidobacteria bacterium]|nr:MAG: hypothetical protein DMG23_00325 [Acidobacteriota bacterium]
MEKRLPFFLRGLEGSDWLNEERGRRLMESRTAEQSSGRVRIAIIAPSLKWVGGQSVQADLLVRHWQNDPAVEARFVPIDPTLPRWLVWTGSIPYLRTVLRMPFYLMALWRALGEVEIAHIFSASYWSFMLAVFPAWLVARLRKRKTVINYHSAEARDHLRRWRSARAVLRRADQIVVPSRYLVEVFGEFGIESRALPNFIDVDRFSYRPRRPLRPRLVCTRGFEPYYSVDVVVRAYAEVKKKFSSARLVLVGKGSREAEIRALVRDLELADVEFAGVSSRETIASAYAQADIFVNASWLDNMPVSILEAFASGTPVASTAAEGIRHLGAGTRLEAGAKRLSRVLALLLVGRPRAVVAGLSVHAEVLGPGARAQSLEAGSGFAGRGCGWRTNR